MEKKSLHFSINISLESSYQTYVSCSVCPLSLSFFFLSPYVCLNIGGVFNANTKPYQPHLTWIRLYLFICLVKYFYRFIRLYNCMPENVGNFIWFYQLMNCEATKLWEAIKHHQLNYPNCVIKSETSFVIRII